MRRILVVYYSRTGYTRTLAGELVSTLEADVDQLDDRRDRNGPWGYLRCAREALKKRTVDLLPTAYDPSHYDLVVLGTPVWAGNLSSPLRSYIVAHRAQLRRVAFFCTQGGSGAQKVLRDMAELCGQPPVATLVVTDHEIERRDYSGKLGAFVRSVMAGVSVANGDRKAVA